MNYKNSKTQNNEHRHSKLITIFLLFLCNFVDLYKKYFSYIRSICVMKNNINDNEKKKMERNF